MKKWYRYLAAGVLVLLTLCVAGCGGVSHKSPEKVTEELIQSYTDGKEKKVKECYNQADNTEADLQTEITATLKYFAAHNPKKVSVQDCEILSENDKYSYVYITYNLIRNIHVLELIWLVNRIKLIISWHHHRSQMI